MKPFEQEWASSGYYSPPTVKALYLINVNSLDGKWPLAEWAGAELVTRQILGLIRSRSRSADPKGFFR